MLGNSLHQRRQQGFTLIELVIVIVIIGILAAIALPKFAALSADARAGTIKGVAGSLASANAAIFAKAQSSGATNTLAANVTGCSNQITLSFGYANTITDLASCVDLTPSTDFVIQGSGIAHNGATNKTTCQVTYTPPANSTVGPAYNINVGDCS